ncbi:MAG: sugar O-acetyltransferase [Prevotella sp.]|jgi:maltose O-acetyltransferase|nr:sugar O-acetyltransferase [Prevotella sp.]
MGDKDIFTEMLSGKMYNDLSPMLIERRRQTIFLTNDYNNSYGEPKIIRETLLRNFLKIVGENVHFEPNFRCEFGFNISIGDNFFANFDCIMLDGNLITIGNNVLLGPRVGLYTSNHAIDPQERIGGGCYANPITIKDNVWIGAGVHIIGGVTIGSNSIIGAGSVITKDIPSNVVATGVPCRVVRMITDNDKTGYETILD